jgi:hypothetical protein
MPHIRLQTTKIASRKMPFLNVDTVILLGDMLVAQANKYVVSSPSLCW